MASTESEHKGSFASQHLSMICKYIGISFVAGAVSHGVFSGSRSLMTAGIGVIMFLIGQFIEYRQTGTGARSMGLSLLIGALLAIGMGFFTGSLQHFPDSPERSLWVVPLGFAMTLAALIWMNKEQLTSTIKRYAAASFVLVGAISLGAHQYFKVNPWVDDHSGHSHGEVATQKSTTEQELAAQDHSAHDHAAPPMQVTAQPNNATASTSHDHSTHDHAAPSAPVVAQANSTSATPSHDHSSHDHATHDHGIDASAIGQAGDPTKVDRIIHVTMSDTMRYEPSAISVKEGETVRLVIENKGQLKHELTLGDPAFLKDHAAKMLKFPNMEHNDPNMVALESGATGEIVWQFTQAGTVDFACLQPGHFEAGMRGAVVVQKSI